LWAYRQTLEHPLEKRKRMQYGINTILVVLIIFASIGLWPVTAAQAKKPHGIILISLDTLRADHLGCYGYHRNTSPSIDDFAKESIVFENAAVQSPWTLPSHMSIMTSLYPSFHGVLKKSSRLGDNHVTLAELLRREGYQTAAFTDGGNVGSIFGFSRGFDLYEENWVGIAETIPKVKKWLDGNGSKPFFLFIHCYDIHSPYNPPPPYNSLFHDFPYRGNLVPSTPTLLSTVNNKENASRITEEDIRHFIALYDGGIRYTDDHIGSFLTYLRESGLYDESLIIITSDHGEEFMEHGAFSHWQLYYRPNLHVPLITHIPGYAGKEIRIDNLVESIDLLPTILDIAGLPSHKRAQGNSLLPLVKQKSTSLPAFLQKVFSRPEEVETVSFAENHTHTPDWAIIQDDYQMISLNNFFEVELFNLKNDPLAQKDIARGHGSLIEQLLLRYNDLYSTKPTYTESSFELDEQSRRQLEALGYIDPAKQASRDTNDADQDGIDNEDDNCPHFQNPGQEDSDQDRVGDVCDSCPETPNPLQENQDFDWIGDACDTCVDTDWDGYGNPGFSNNCQEDNCPTIFNPRQEDTDGDGTGDACEMLQVESHWMEAEQAGTIQYPLMVADDKKASKGKYVYSEYGTANQYTPGKTMASYRVTVDQPGVYLLWGRVSAAGGRNDSFFVQVDNGANTVWNVQVGKNWHWDMVKSGRKTHPVIFPLTAGEHTIKIKLRENGTKLDKLLLTNDTNLVPAGKGKPAQK
jgi:arylsulfatase A-like enzyme